MFSRMQRLHHLALTDSRARKSQQLRRPANPLVQLRRWFLRRGAGVMRRRLKTGGLTTECLENRTLLSARAIVFDPVDSPGTHLKFDDGSDSDAWVLSGSGALDTLVKDASMGGWVTHAATDSVDEIWLDLNGDGDRDPGEPQSSMKIQIGTHTDFSLPVSLPPSVRAHDVGHTDNIVARFHDNSTVSKAVSYTIVDMKFTTSSYTFGPFEEGCTTQSIGSVVAYHHTGRPDSVSYEFTNHGGDNRGNISFAPDTNQLKAANGLDFETADDGVYQFGVRADNGEQAEASVTVRVTDVTPTIAITTPANNQVSDDAFPEVQWTATHPLTPSGQYRWTLFRQTGGGSEQQIRTGLVSESRLDLSEESLPLVYGGYRLLVSGNNCLGELAQDSVTFRVMARPVWKDAPDDLTLCECEDGQAPRDPFRIPTSPAYAGGPSFRFAAWDPDNGAPPTAHKGITQYELSGPLKNKFELHPYDSESQLWVTGNLNFDNAEFIDLEVIATDDDGSSAAGRTVVGAFRISVEDVPKLPAPVITAPTSQIVSLSGLDDGRLRVAWNAVTHPGKPNAPGPAPTTRYRVALSDLGRTDAHGKPLVVYEEDLITETERHVPADLLENGGVYRVTVQAINCDEERTSSEFDFIYMQTVFATDVYEDYAETVCECDGDARNNKPADPIGADGTTSAHQVTAVGDFSLSPSRQILPGPQDYQVPTEFLPALMSGLDNPVFEVDLRVPDPVIPASANLPDLSTPDRVRLMVTIVDATGTPVSSDDGPLVFDREVTQVAASLSGRDARLGLQVPNAATAGLPTGAYAHQIEVTLFYGDSEVNSTAVTELKAVVDRSSSEFGARWWLPGLDVLIPPTESQPRATLLRGNGTSVIFEADASEFLTPSGSFTRLKRDGDGFTATSAVGTVHRFNAVGQLQSISRRGRTLLLDYRSDGRLDLITEADTGRTMKYGYAGNNVRITDFVGREWFLARDESGRVTQFKSPDADGPGGLPRPRFDYIYSGADDLPMEMIDPLGRTTTFVFDEHDKLTALTIDDGADAPEHVATWLSAGQHSQILNGLPATDDLRGVVTYPDSTAATKRIDRFGHTIHEVNRRGLTIERPRNDDGLVVSMKGPYRASTEADTAHTTAYTYDDHRLTRITYADGSFETWLFSGDRADQPSKYTDRIGRTIEYPEYDADSGLALKEIHGFQGQVIGTYEYTYEHGMMRSMLSPLPGSTAQAEGHGNSVQTIWNYYPAAAGSGSAGQLMSVEYPDGTSEAWTYDSHGFVAHNRQGVTPTDTGELTARTWDTLGRNLSTTLPALSDEPSPPVYQTAYDVMGNTLQETDPLGRVTEFEYDFMNRVSRIWLPDPDDTGPLPRPEYHYTYDDAGHLRTLRDPAGATTHFSFDPHGNLVWESVPVADGTNFDESSPRTTYEIDSQGRITRASVPVRATQSRTTEYLYDDVGRSVLVTDANGNATEYEYDAEGRPKRITSPESETGEALKTVYTYHDGIKDGIGRRIDVRDPAGTTTHHYVGAVDELIKVRHEIPEPGAAAERLHVVYEYDANGRLTRESQSAGELTRDTQYTWDARGYPDRVITPDPDGPDGPLSRLITDYDYSGGGHLAAITTPDGLRTVNTYNPDGTLATTTRVSTAGDEQQTAYLYDNLERVVSTTAPDGGTTAYAYDLAGNLKTVTAPDPLDGTPTGPVTSYGYNATGRFLNRVWDARNPSPDMAEGDRKYLTELAWDLAGQLRMVTFPDPDPEDDDAARARVRYEYDPAGNLIWERDARHNKVHYRYDNLDRLIEVGQSTTATPYEGREYFTYSEGRLDTHTDVLGLTTSFAWDDLSRLRSVTNNEGSTTTTDYDGFGRVVATTLPDPITGAASGPRTDFSYDLLDRPIRSVDPVGAAQRWEYNSRGLLTREFDAEERRTTYFYDDFARIDEVRHGNWTAGSQAYTKTTYDYDVMNRVRSLSNRANDSESYGYDYLGRKVWQENAEHGPDGRIEYSYDDVGNLTTLTDPVGNTTTFAYDARNRMVSEQIIVGTTPLTRSWEYDQVNNLVAKTDRNARRTEYEWAFRYNGGTNFRLDRESWIENDEVVRNITATYNDGVGESGLLLTRLTDPDSRLRFEYDQMARVSEVKDELLRATDTLFVLEHEYDRLGRRTTTSSRFKNLPAGEPTSPGPPGESVFRSDFINSYTWDEASRLDTIRQHGDGVTDKSVNLDWNADSTLARISRFENDNADAIAVSDYEFDTDVAGRLTAITHNDGSGTVLAEHLWTHTSAGLIETTTDRSGTREYDYDKLQQLTSVTLDGELLESYSYDENGNRNSQNYDTGPHNRLLRQPLPDGRFEYEYDAEGNRVTRRRYDLADRLVEEFRYTWDHRNRLTALEVHRISDADSEPGGPTDGPQSEDTALARLIEYKYDGLDRRIERRVTDIESPGQSTHQRFVYDTMPGAGSDHLVMVLDADDDFSVSSRYLHGPIVDQVFARESGGEVEWFLTDHQGTVRDIAVTTGGATTVSAELDYTGFGGLTRSDDTADQSGFRYTGRYWDPDAELYYYRARWYDPTAGRFLNDDPSGFAAGDVNLTRMAGNSTPNAIDPTGRQEEPIFNNLKKPTVSAPKRSAYDQWMDNPQFSPEALDSIAQLPKGVWETFIRRYGTRAAFRFQQIHDWGFVVRVKPLFTGTCVEAHPTDGRVLYVDDDTYSIPHGFSTYVGPRVSRALTTAELALELKEGLKDKALRPPSTAANTMTPGNTITAGTYVEDPNTGEARGHSQHVGLAMSANTSVGMFRKLRNEFAFNAGVTAGVGVVLKLDDLIRIGKRAKERYRQWRRARAACKHAPDLDTVRKTVGATLHGELGAIRKLAPDAKLGYRGSLARGTKGPHKGNAPFDPTDFDVDAFIVSDKLAARFSKKAWFRSGDRISGLSDIQKRVLKQLQEQFPGMRREFTFRIYTQAEFLNKVKKNAHTLVD